MALLAVLTASTVRGAEGQGMALTLLSVQHLPNEHEAELSLRNDGATSVVAWVVEVIESYPNSKTASFFLTMDAYEDAAGLIEPHSRYRNRVLRPGGTLSWTVRLPRRPDREATSVNVRLAAALLEGDVLVGDQAHARGILNQRGRDAQALAELLSVLQSARAAHGDSSAAVRSAVDALRIVEADHSAKKLAYGNLRRTLDRAEQGTADPGEALTTLIEQTRRRAAAATAAHAALQSTIEPPSKK